MSKDFTDFQRYFLKYQKLFGLTGYEVYFKHESIDGCFASITASQTDMVATVTLNRKLDGNSKPHKDIKRSAKHEAIHLLLHELEHRACSRYLSSDQIYEAVEELVNKLEELIED